MDLTDSPPFEHSTDEADSMGSAAAESIVIQHKALAPG